MLFWRDRLFRHFTFLHFSFHLLGFCVSRLFRKGCLEKGKEREHFSADIRLVSVPGSDVSG